MSQQLTPYFKRLSLNSGDMMGSEQSQDLHGQLVQIDMGGKTQ
jgi:hypothetical protein